MPTTVRTLDLDTYQSKYKYNASNYLRSVNSNKELESKFYKDFFTRLNRVRDFHKNEDNKNSITSSITSDYYTNFGYNVDSSKKNYASSTTWDDSIPGLDEAIMYNKTLDGTHLQAALSNLINNIPKVKSGLSLTSSGAVTNKINSVMSGINVDQYITAEKYNEVSNFIKQIEMICAHNSSDYSKCYCRSKSTSSGGGGGGGGGEATYSKNNSTWSPVMGNGSGCPDKIAGGCDSGNCNSNNSKCPTHLKDNYSNYPSVGCSGYNG